MRAHAVIWLVLALAVTGCSTSRRVRLDTGAGPPTVHTPLAEDDAGPVELDDDEFEEAVVALARDVRPFSNPLREARQRFGVPERSGVYLYEGRGPRLIPQGGAMDSDGPRLLESYSDDELTRAYGTWCERKSQPGDCLRLLADGPLLASDGKYTLAMAISMDSVWDETAEALEDMADPQSLLATVSASVSMHLHLWSLPEPVSKGLAALLTATAIAYLGVDTVWRILDGWVTLVREVERATTFAQLNAAGEAYGEVLGENAARVFVMLATAAVGNTAGLAAKTSKLPGSAQAALAVEAQAGYRYAATGSVHSVAMTAEGFTVALAPNAVAMTARGMRGGRPEKHHLATNKNSVSTARGGPWTPRFRRLFKKAGMRLEDPENIVPVASHKGPHPQKYHELVFRRLDSATARCRSVEECRTTLTKALQLLAKEAATKGTDINKLLTERKQR
ncbi:AHH domain-containing protein [Corallococcus macrosporus]|uniref:Putative lipoprotein n=1 Tax=Myxococcus fulvus (strain ATCC BAA-855 / HW-1) TaxID=483219 RepID=F8CM59_MYXFH|nr:AHH domain-containing protein [Corallococcus macrosporus]AEI62827.1 putative lipoprotein [Corallococcus macrosporus]